MDKLDLAALIPDIDICLKSYEDGCRKGIAKSQPEQVEVYALSLHVSPVMQGIFALNLMDSASMTQEEVYNEHAQHIPEAEIKKSDINKEDDLKKQFYFDWECETVDPKSEYYSLIKPNYGKDTTLKGPVLSDPFKVKIESNILKGMNSYYAKNFDLNKSAENCFNCDLSFKIETTYPGIEMAWEFDKFLKQIEDFINTIKNNIDPTAIYSQLCNLKMFVGKNYMCPTNMLNLNLMLPALFMKYTLDLGKLSFDANFIVGGLIKAIFSTIAAFLENLRSLIMPFLNCYIDGINTTFGYIKSVVSSISKTVDGVGDALERTWGAIAKSAAQIADIFNTTSSEDLEENIKKSEKLIESMENEYKKLSKSLDEKYSYKSRAKAKLQKIEDRLYEIKQLVSERAVVAYVLKNEKTVLKNSGANVLEYSEFESLFNQYFSKESDQTKFAGIKKADLDVDAIFRILKTLDEEQKILSEDDIPSMEGWMVKNSKNISDLKKEISTNESSIQENKAKIKSLGKDSIFERVSVGNTFVNNTTGFMEDQPGPSLKATPRYKTGSTLHSVGASFNENFLGPWKNIEPWLTKRYGLKTSSQYMKTEYFKTFREKVKKYEKTGIDTLEDVRLFLVKPAETLKTFINDFIGNVINALHNLNILFSQGAMSEIKILGELLQLTHLIRLIRVIMKMISEGIGGCEEVADNKQKQEQFKEIVENINPDLNVEFFNQESEELKSEKTFAKIYAKDSNYAHLLNAKDCSELSFHTEKKSNDLDSIYNSLKEALI